MVDAPRELVFDVFTKPVHIAHWWGPIGFRKSIEALDLRPGGKFLVTMYGPHGTDYLGALK